MDTPKNDYKPREWHKNFAWIPEEHVLKDGSLIPNTAFRTHDQDIYIRHGETGVIRRARPKVKGKAARKADKKRRRNANTK